MIAHLSDFLRLTLREKDAQEVPLEQELAFLNAYLAIMRARFSDRLRVDVTVDPAARDALVPHLLLQPLVENSIKHGISGKIDGGTITLRARRASDRLVVEVEDDGVGIPQDERLNILSRGIGVTNVQERLKVLYNQDYRMLIDSEPGRGTRIEIELPEIQARLRAVS